MKTLTLGAAALLLGATAAQAEYPARPIAITVPAPAGGGTDTSVRMLATLLESELGTSIAILNAAGGGGSVGVTQFMQARPDGYALLATWNSPITTVPQMQPTAYAPDSFVPVASTSETAYTLCVAPSFPAETGEEFLAELAANPGRYTYGNDGIGGTMQFAAERIFQVRGIEAIAVPFGGAGETLQNFLGGHVDIYGGSISPVLPYTQSGEAKCLIVTSAAPVSALTQAAGLEELGLGDEETLLWRMVLAPAGTDQAIVDRLSAALETTVNSPEYVEFLAGVGEVPNVVTGEALGARLQAEFDALAELAQALGLAQ